jgi:hypothetical protein
MNEISWPGKGAVAAKSAAARSKVDLHGVISSHSEDR